MATVDIALDIKTRAIDSLYTYLIPQDLKDDIKIGMAVLIDFQNKKEIGYVMSVDNNKGQSDLNFKAKHICEIIGGPYFSNDMANVLLWIAHKYISPISAAVKLALPAGSSPKIIHHKNGTFDIKKPAEIKKKTEICADAYVDKNASKPDELTPEQKKALSAVTQAVDSNEFQGILIDGITGSGKTEVYLGAIEHVLNEGKQAIVLVPEIALTPQTFARFTSRFPDKVACIHSKLTAKERRILFQNIRDGKVSIVIGPRSALFSPLKNVGLIVIDEEHESTYKQESSPRYHAREVAKKMMQNAKGALVLGSATPSLESLYCCKNSKNWQRVVMEHRANGSKLPKVKIVDMTKIKKHGNYQMFSWTVFDSIKKQLELSHKCVVFLNQRGFAKFLLCHDCGFVPECPNCSTSLTFHETDKTLRCHSCGYRVSTPPVCPKCGSPYLKKLGGGTQRVASELQAFLDTCGDFDDCKIIRMDSDTTSSRGTHSELLQQFASAKRAILLGTQMIAKGLDFSDVTLVCVINADTVMHVPDFRSSERTYCMLEQVSGRAGRARLPGEVLVQTYESDNCAIRSAAAHDREMFLRVELPKRKILKYPPYVQIARVLVWSKNEDLAKNAAFDVNDEIVEEIQIKKLDDLYLSGANPCPFGKIAGNYRWHIVIKSPLSFDFANVFEHYFRKKKMPRGVFLAVDVDPQQMV